MRIRDLLKKYFPKEEQQGVPSVEAERISKHMHGKFRSTKAYKDDRQKATHNRRKNGRRKRR